MNQMMNQSLVLVAALAPLLALSAPQYGEAAHPGSRIEHLKLPGDPGLQEHGKTGLPEKPNFFEKRPRVEMPGPHIQVAWDNFEHRNADIWQCRELKSGRFVPPRACKSVERNDLAWPGKSLPANYAGTIID